MPKRLLDVASLKRFTAGSTNATIRIAGENVIVEVARDEIEMEEDDDGIGWLEALAPLRGDVLDGDLRLLYLTWVPAAQNIPKLLHPAIL